MACKGWVSPLPVERWRPPPSRSRTWFIDSSACVNTHATPLWWWSLLTTPTRASRRVHARRTAATELSYTIVLPPRGPAPRFFPRFRCLPCDPSAKGQSRFLETEVREYSANVLVFPLPPLLCQSFIIIVGILGLGPLVVVTFYLYFVLFLELELLSYRSILYSVVLTFYFLEQSLDISNKLLC